MKIYYSRYLSYDKHHDKDRFLCDQKERTLHVITYMNKYFNDNFIHVHEKGGYWSCFLFPSFQEAFESIPYDDVFGMKIVEYDLSEKEISTLIFSKELDNIVPSNVWYFVLSKESKQFEEFKMKAFL